MIGQSRQKSQMPPAPGECRPLTPKYCAQRLFLYSALTLVFVLSSWLLCKGDWLRRIVFALYSLPQFGQALYWLDMLRRVRRGEVIDLVYPTAFRRRTKEATIFGKIGAIAVAFLISLLTLCALRTATHQGLALNLFLLALNIGTWWLVNHVFTRNDIIMKAPTVKIAIAASVTGNSAVAQQ